MLFKAIVVCMAALPLLTAAGPVAGSQPNDGGNHCNTGSLNCCDPSNTADAQTFAEQNGLIGLIANLLVPVQLSCTQIGVVALNTISCSQQLSCCDNVQANGQLVGINCSPVNLAL